MRTVRTRRVRIRLALIALSILFLRCLPIAEAGPSTHIGDHEAIVVGAVDGDTLDVRVGTNVLRLRLIGIDTPEMDGPDVCEARQALRYLEGLVPVGSTVTFSYDVQPFDRYGRHLVNLWSAHRWVNGALVQAGLARPAPIPPNLKYAHVVDALAQAARPFSCNEVVHAIRSPPGRDPTLPPRTGPGDRRPESDHRQPSLHHFRPSRSLCNLLSPHQRQHVHC